MDRGYDIILSAAAAEAFPASIASRFWGRLPGLLDKGLLLERGLLLTASTGLFDVRWWRCTFLRGFQLTLRMWSQLVDPPLLHQSHKRFHIFHLLQPATEAPLISPGPTAILHPFRQCINMFSWIIDFQVHLEGVFG